MPRHHRRRARARFPEVLTQVAADDVLSRRYTSLAFRIMVGDMLWMHRFLRASFKNRLTAARKVAERIDFPRWHRVFSPRFPTRLSTEFGLYERVRRFIYRVWDLDTLAQVDGYIGFWEVFMLLPVEAFSFEIAEVVFLACVDMGAPCDQEKVAFENAAEKWLAKIGVPETVLSPRASRVLQNWSTNLRREDFVEPRRMSTGNRLCRYAYFLGLPPRFQANTQPLRDQRFWMERGRPDLAYGEMYTRVATPGGVPVSEGGIPLKIKR